MRANRRTFATALAVALFPPAAFTDGDPDEPPHPGAKVDGYRNFTQQALGICSSLIHVKPRETTPVHADLVRLRDCITTRLHEGRLLFESSMRGLRKKSVREALKDYHGVFETALNALMPVPDELPAAYEQRQTSMRHVLAHAWTRFELEER